MSDYTNSSGRFSETSERFTNHSQRLSRAFQSRQKQSGPALSISSGGSVSSVASMSNIKGTRSPGSEASNQSLSRSFEFGRAAPPHKEEGTESPLNLSHASLFSPTGRPALGSKPSSQAQALLRGAQQRIAQNGKVINGLPANAKPSHTRTVSTPQPGLFGSPFSATRQSFLLPDLQNLSQILQPGFRALRGRASRVNEVDPNNGHIHVDEVPAAEDERAIIASLVMLQERIAQLEHEKSEDEVRFEEYERHIVDLQTQIQEQECARRSDSALGSSDDDRKIGSATARLEVEKSRLESLVQSLKEKATSAERAAAVADKTAQRVTDERDSLVSQLGNAWAEIEICKKELAVSKKENFMLASKVESLNNQNQHLLGMLEMCDENINIADKRIQSYKDQLAEQDPKLAAKLVAKNESLREQLAAADPQLAERLADKNEVLRQRLVAAEDAEQSALCAFEKNQEERDERDHNIAKHLAALLAQKESLEAKIAASAPDLARLSDKNEGLRKKLVAAHEAQQSAANALSKHEQEQATRARMIERAFADIGDQNQSLISQIAASQPDRARLSNNNESLRKKLIAAEDAQKAAVDALSKHQEEQQAHDRALVIEFKQLEEHKQSLVAQIAAFSSKRQADVQKWANAQSQIVYAKSSGTGTRSNSSRKSSNRQQAKINSQLREQNQRLENVIKNMDLDFPAIPKHSHSEAPAPASPRSARQVSPRKVTIASSVRARSSKAPSIAASCRSNTRNISAPDLYHSTEEGSTVSTEATTTSEELGQDINRPDKSAHKASRSRSKHKLPDTFTLSSFGTETVANARRNIEVEYLNQRNLSSKRRVVSSNDALEKLSGPSPSKPAKINRVRASSHSSEADYIGTAGGSENSACESTNLDSPATQSKHFIHAVSEMTEGHDADMAARRARHASAIKAASNKKPSDVFQKLIDQAVEHSQLSRPTMDAARDIRRSSRKTRRPVSTHGEITSAFLLPDITLDMSKSKGLSKTAHKIMDPLAPHDPKQCTQCARITECEDTVEIPPAIPLTSTMAEGDVDATIRPTEAPYQALSRVIKELHDEVIHLKLEFRLAQRRLDAIAPGKQRCLSDKVHESIDRLMQLIRAKDAQLYSLHDVLEAHKHEAPEAADVPASTAAAAAAAATTAEQDITEDFTEKVDSTVSSVYSNVTEDARQVVEDALKSLRDVREQQLETVTSVFEGFSDAFSEE